MKVPVDLALTLVAAVEAGTLDGAAKALHLTQSAVSQRIASLERLTGQVLLVRSRPVRATAAGERVIRYARQVSHLDDDLADHLGLGAAATTIPLAINADSLATWILPALAGVANEHDLVLEIHREDESHTTELLADGTVVAAVTTVAHPVAGCSATRLGTLQYRAVAAPAFVERWLPDGATPRALAHSPVVDFDDRDQIQRRYLRQRGADPSTCPRHYVPSSSEFADAIELGLGWGLLPESQRQGRSLVELGGPEITVTLWWQQWRTHAATLGLVADAVTAAARSGLSP